MSTSPTGYAPVQQGVNTNHAQNESNLSDKQEKSLSTGQKVAVVALAIFVAAALLPLAAIAPPFIILAPVVGILLALAVADSFKERNVVLVETGVPVTRLHWYHSPILFWNWTVFRPRRWHFIRTAPAYRHNVRVQNMAHPARGGALPVQGVASTNQRKSFKHSSFFGNLFSDNRSKASSGRSSTTHRPPSTRSIGGGLSVRGFGSGAPRTSIGRTSILGGRRR